MKSNCLLAPVLGTLLCAGLAGCGPTAGGASIDFQKIIATAKEKVYPSLVFVKPIRETFEAGERRRAEVFGSGVIVSSEGYVLTNNHVAEKAIEVNCVLGDREQVPASVVGLDPETDLALLKLKLPPNHAPLAVAAIGDSNNVEAGQFVMALGAPFGFTRSISLGIISNTKRYIGFTTQYRYNLWLQTDAAINPGNSGGPLVNTQGQVIGINTLGTMAEGIGFAIPSNVALDVFNRLRLAAGKTDPKKWPVKVDRAFTGLQLQALNDFNTNTFTESKHGVLIQSVDTESPARRAGIENGDILVAVNGRAVDGLYVEDLPMIRVMLADLPTDQPAEFLVARKPLEAGHEAASKPAAEKPLSPEGEGGPKGRAKATSSTAPTPVRPSDWVEPPAAASRAGAAAMAHLSFTAKDVGDRMGLQIVVVPVDRGKFEGEDFDCRRWNMTVKEITKFSNPYLYFLQPSGGVYIQGVRMEGNGADAGLRTNDILLKIGTADIKTLADVKKVYESLVNNKDLTEKKILVTIKRGGFIQWQTLNWQKDYLNED